MSIRVSPDSPALEPAPNATRAAPAELEPARFRALGHDLVDRIADFLASLPTRPVAPGESPREVRAAIGERALPERGEAPDAMLRDAAELLFAHSTFNGHPRFFGYITSSAAPLGALADLLAAAVNPNCGAWGLSPAATEIERQTVRWLAELLGFPTECGGLLVSGGNMANMVCCWAALRAAAPWNARGAGIAAGGRLVLYASAETHTWIEKAADLSGLGTEAVRRVPTDEQGRMRAEALRGMIEDDRAAGAIPAFVVGTAGTVSTGVVDPLPALAAICRAAGVWFHVDGAYGAPAVLLPDAPPDLAGLALADSVAVDPHKWLYAPLEAGCAIVRDPEKLRAAYSFTPPYYHFEGAEEDPPVNFFEWGPQNSRGFRALKVWLGLRQMGREGLARSIADDCALARQLHAHVEAHPELEAFTSALSITTFRFVPRDLRGRGEAGDYLSALNSEVLSETQRRGGLYLSNAVIGGQFLMRACIVNFRTTARDVAMVPELVASVGRELDATLRPDTLRAR